MHCDPNMAADIIPVDIAINAIIVSAWERGIQEESAAIEFRNITLSHDKQMTWGESVDKGSYYAYNIFVFFLGLPFLSMYKNNICSCMQQKSFYLLILSNDCGRA